MAELDTYPTQRWIVLGDHHERHSIRRCSDYTEDGGAFYRCHCEHIFYFETEPEPVPARCSSNPRCLAWIEAE